MNHKMRETALSLFFLGLVLSSLSFTPAFAKTAIGFSHHEVNILMRPGETKTISVFRVYDNGNESLDIQVEMIQDPETELMVKLTQNELTLLPDNSQLISLEIRAIQNGNYSFIVAVSIVAENILGNPIIPGAENECNVEVSDQKPDDFSVEEPKDVQVSEPQNEDSTNTTEEDSAVIPQEKTNTEEKTKTPIIEYIVGVGILGVIGVGILVKIKYRRENPRKEESSL